MKTYEEFLKNNLNEEHKDEIKIDDKKMKKEIEIIKTKIEELNKSWTNKEKGEYYIDIIINSIEDLLYKL